MKETRSRLGGLGSVRRPVRQRFRLRYNSAKFLVPSDSVLVPQDGHWLRRSEQTARARRGPLVSVRQPVGNGSPSLPVISRTEKTYILIIADGNGRMRASGGRTASFRL